MQESLDMSLTSSDRHHFGEMASLGIDERAESEEEDGLDLTAHGESGYNN